MWTIFLLLMYLAFKAWASQITGHGNTSAEFGGEAHFKCELDDPKGVLQFTWQRLYEDNSIENVASYSKRFGEQVNEPYKDKIVMTEASLQSSSITVRNLTWADESCYVCSFNSYPGGSKRHLTCLKVQGVSKVKTQVYPPIDEPEKNEVIFNCSATGKPAPKIQWEYSPHVTVVEESQTSVLTNDDRTLTSSRDVTLQLTPEWDGHVYCLINPGMRGEKRETITYTRTKENNGGGTFHTPIFVSIILVILMMAIISSTLLLYKPLKRLCFSSNCESNVI